MRGLAAPLIKSLVFIVVTVLLTGLLAVSIANTSGGGNSYTAMFTDATSVNKGDDIRMAGVRIGTVQSIGIVNRNTAKITFSLDSDVKLASTVTAAIRYRTLVGQRYIALDQGAGSPDITLANHATIPLTRTQPALDLTVLFNGFQPLFQALDPASVNKLSYEVVQLFQGEGSTVDDLLTQTASLTTTLASKDQVIGEVIDNLNSVLKNINTRGDQLATTVTTLQQLVSGLAEDRDPIGSAISGIAGLTTSVSGLLVNGRAPLQKTITSLGALSGNLAQQSPALNQFLANLPTKLNSIGKLASYGSWVNFYVCSLSGKIPVPTDYSGGVGIQPVASRCQG